MEVFSMRCDMILYDASAIGIAYDWTSEYSFVCCSFRRPRSVNVNHLAPISALMSSVKRWPALLEIEPTPSAPQQTRTRQDPDIRSPIECVADLKGNRRAWDGSGVARLQGLSKAVDILQRG